MIDLVVALDRINYFDLHGIALYLHNVEKKIKNYGNLNRNQNNA